MEARELTDSQLVLTIRQIQTSPRGNRSWKLEQMTDRYLAEIRAEAQRRGLK